MYRAGEVFVHIGIQMLVDCYCLFTLLGIKMLVHSYRLLSISEYTRFIILEPPHDKTNKMTVRPAKTQIRLGIRPVWSESSLCAQWVAKDPSFFHADSEDSDQTGWSLRWTHMSFCWFCHEVAHILLFVISSSCYSMHDVYNCWHILTSSEFFLGILPEYNAM